MENEIVKIVRVDDENFATSLNCSLDELLNAISILGKEVSEFFANKDFSDEELKELLTRTILSRIDEEE